MMRKSNNRRARTSGLTLIELLVVIFIMMIFVAAAAPLVNPATSDRKIREASRQLNAYMAEAKAHAAQRGRPVGIAFDQASAVREGSRDSNLVSRMYLVEVPPIYTGDTLGSTVQFWLSADPALQAPRTFAPPSVTVGGVNRPAIKLQLNFSNVPPPTSTTSLLTSLSANPMLDSIFVSYLPQGQTIGSAPFSIRMGGRGSYRVAYVDVNTANTPPTKYYAWIVYGDPMYNYCFNALSQGLNFPNGVTVPLGISDPRSPGANPPNFWYYSDSFQIGLPPVVTGDTQLELPTGTVVDLQFSGYSSSGTEFFDSTRIMPTPLQILFSPGGEVGFVQNYNQTIGGNPFSAAAGRINLLVGTRKRDAEAPSRTFSPGDDRIPRVTNNEKSNLNDPANLWVSVNPRTGLVTTAENKVTQTLNDVQTAVHDARLQAIKLNTKGGR